jgi:PAS domain S-box-containing protein
MGLLAGFRLAKPFLPQHLQNTLSGPAAIVDQATLITAGLALAGGFALFLYSYIRGQSDARQRSPGLLVGLSIVVLAVLGGYLLPQIAGWPVPVAAVPALEPVTLLVLLITLGAAILRDELFEIRVELSRGIVYAFTSAILICLYLIIAVGLIHVLGQATRTDDPVLVAMLVLLTMVLLNPLRRWGQRFVDHLFFRKQYDYRQVLREFGQDLSRLQELAVLTRSILDRVVRTWELETAALVLREERDDPFLVREVHNLPEALLGIPISQDAEAVQTLSQEGRSLRLSRAEWVARMPADEKETVQALQGVLIIPFWAKGKLMGWLHLGEKRSERPYTSDDLELLSTLADQASVALENAQLFERSRREVAASEVLNRISLVATTSELDDLLEQIYREVDLLVDAPNFYIALYDKGAQEFSFAFQVVDGTRRWFEEGPPRWPLGSGLTSHVVRTRAAIVTRDYVAECDRRGTEPRGLSRQDPALAWLGVPLAAGTRVLGVLCVSSSREGTVYRTEHVRLLSTIAAQAAAVIERVRLRELEQQRTAELETLNEIARAIGSSIYLDELLQAIHRAVQRVILVPNFYITLYDEERAEFSFALYLEKGQPVQPSVERWPFGDGLSSEIVRQRRPIVTDDYLAECALRGVSPVGQPSKAWLGVPMIVGEEIIGVMGLRSFDAETVYAQEDTRILSTIAVQAAGAIQNAHLFQESRRRSEELASLFQVGTAIVSTLDLQEVLDAVCREAVNVLRASSAHLYEWDEEQRAITILASHAAPEILAQDVATEPEVTYTEEVGVVELLRQGQPFTIHLSAASPLPEEEERAGESGGLSALLLPLIAREQVLGYIKVRETRYDRVFTEDEILLGQNLASQAAIAIENARLYARTDAALARRVEELTAIEQIARELNTTLDFRQVIELVLDQALSATAATAGVVSMLSPDKEGLLLLTYRGYSEAVSEPYRSRPWSLQDGVMGRVVRTNRPALVPDVRQDPDYAEMASSSRSELAVPIRYGGQPIGAINLESDQLAAFDEQHLRFLQQLADHAAVAMRNARQFEDQVRQTRLLEQKTAQLTELLRVGNAMRAQLDLPEVLQTIVEGVSRGLRFNTALLSLVDPEDPSHLVRMASVGISEQEFDRLQSVPVPRQKLSRIMQPEFRLGNAYFLDHRYADFDALWGDDVPVHTPDLGEWTEGQWHPDDIFIIPLLGSDGHLLGILSLDVPADRQLPSLEVAQALQLFANQAVTAIENASLFQQVIEARDRLQAILDSTHEGIMMLNEDGIILLVNPAIQRRIGLPRDEIVGLALIDLLRKGSRGGREIRQALLEELRRGQQALRDDPQITLQGDFEVHFGGLRAFEWLSAPVQDRHGQTLGRILVLRDVTETREVERMREDLSSMIVHDLRGPLTAFLGALETLLRKEGGPLTEVQQTLLGVAHDGGKQMLGMVSTLLDIRRLEVGKMPLDFSRTHLSQVAQGAVAPFESLAQEQRLTILVEVSPQLPPVQADAEKITRVFENLLHNAIRFSFPGGIIRLTAREQDGVVQCTVEDHGVGIPESELGKVFEKFFQAHRTGAPRGTGLGLAFCRLAVEAHGGRIWVESREGQGSSFHFTLPIWTEGSPGEPQ